MPVEELTLKTASLANILDWLTQPQGPHLVDGTSTKDPLTALAFLITPEALYESDSPMVGLDFVYKAPYIRAALWSEAYFKARHEASLASEAATLTRRSSSRGESSTPPQELPLTTWPQPPSTPTLEWREVDRKVAEVMDQVHNLHLEMVQEMGFVREVDQALSKSLMVEFLRLKVITGDDLSATLRTWQTDMEAATDKFLRDLDAVTQTSTTLPSKNAAVGAALRKYREAAQLRLALPLTRLDET